MGGGCLSTQFDELLVTASLIGPQKSALLAEDLERVGLPREVAELESLPGEHLARSEVALEHRPRGDPDLRDPAQRGLREGRRELLLAVTCNLRLREIARLVADV